MTPKQEKVARKMLMLIERFSETGIEKRMWARVPYPVRRLFYKGKVCFIVQRNPDVGSKTLTFTSALPESLFRILSKK